MENLLFTSLIKTPGFLISFGIASILTAILLPKRKMKNPEKEEGKDPTQELMERGPL